MLQNKTASHPSVCPGESKRKMYSSDGVRDGKILTQNIHLKYEYTSTHKCLQPFLQD